MNETPTNYADAYRAAMRAALVALLDKIGDGWYDGCGCCSSETLNKDTDEVRAVQALLDEDKD